MGRRGLGRRGGATLAGAVARLVGAAAAGVVVVGAVAAGSGAVGTSSVALAEDEVTASIDPVRVSLTGLAPVALTATSDLSASGTISNSGLETLTEVSVRLTISTMALPDRRSLRTGTDIGAAVETTPLYDSTEEVAGVLRPGAKRQYRVTADESSLPVSAPGIYVVGVEVTGVGPAGFVILGSTYSLMPYVPEPIDPVNVVWLWPLASWPAQTPDGVLLTDVVSRDVQEDGRLTQLLTVGRTTPALTWVIDPQLLQMTADMSNGYLVERGGEIRPGSDQQGAASWLDLLRRTLNPAQKGKGDPPRIPDLASLPYADPDADATVRSGLAGDVVRATTMAAPMTEEHLEREPDSVMAWAAGGRMTAGALDALASAGVTSVVMRDNAMPVSTTLDYTPSGYADIATDAGKVRALLLDSGLLRALTLPQGNLASVLQARQRFISELAFIALEPAPRPRHVVAGSGSVRWSPNPRLLNAILAALRGTSWSRLVPVSAMLELPANNVTRISADYDSKARGRELSSDYLDSLISTQESLDSLRSVLTTPARSTAGLTSALLRAESAAWRTRERTGLELLASIDADIARTTSAVYVIPRDNVTFSGDRGSVPITVANDHDQDVIVGVQVTADPASRLETTPLTDVVIEAGKRASLEVPVRIVGGGALSVDIQLTDGRGNDFGEAVPLELRTTAYSRAATWVAVGAAILLGLLVIFDIVRRARGRRRPTPEAAA